MVSSIIFAVGQSLMSVALSGRGIPTEIVGAELVIHSGDLVGLEYRILGLTWGLRVWFDHAVIWYSLVSPSRIGLRRTWWSARLITGGGWVSAWAGASCPSVRCGRAVLKWCK
jgi:hypothetical protein